MAEGEGFSILLDTAARLPADLPRGISRVRLLPDPGLGELWNSIHVETSVKDRLLSQAVQNFTVRKAVSRSVLPLHGIILLVGPPGTGKTSLARGLSSRLAASFQGGRFRLVEVDPHQLSSSAMGKTQRAVSELFSEGLTSVAGDAPTVVLLDEVETLAVDRSRLSMDANPIDVHRATDAVLVQLDALAESHPNILFVATSNFPKALDGAFTSRCDLVLEVPPPTLDGCRSIVEDCLSGVARAFPPIGRLRTSDSLDRLATACVGLDGRAVRKAIANGLASSPEIAMDPGSVRLDDLLRAVQAAKASRAHLGGVA